MAVVFSQEQVLEWLNLYIRYSVGQALGDVSRHWLTSVNIDNSDIEIGHWSADKRPTDGVRGYSNVANRLS